MPDDREEERKAEEARRLFEEAEREIEEMAGPPRRPEQDGKGESKPSLRLVEKKPEVWFAPTWQPTGEAVVLEFVRRQGADFYPVLIEGVDYVWTGTIWQRDECCTLENKFAELCRQIGSDKNKKTIRNNLESARFISGGTRRGRALLAKPLDQLDRSAVLNIGKGSSDV